MAIFNTEVIKLNPKDFEGYSAKRINKHTCRHLGIEVDIENREIRCTSCNTELDAFEFVANMAMVTENHFAYMLHLQKQNEELEQRKSALEQNVSRLKSKEKRLSNPTAINGNKN